MAYDASMYPGMMPLLSKWRLAVALYLLAAMTVAEAAEANRAEFRLEYQKTLSQTMSQGAKVPGKYLGSGKGTVSGAVNGDVVWDLYEDQGASQLHRTQFVGQIRAPDGSSIDFETLGYFVPRSGASSFWDLTSAIYFFSARGPAFQSLHGALGVWEGDVDTRTYSHHYRLRLLEPPDHS